MIGPKGLNVCHQRLQLRNFPEVSIEELWRPSRVRLSGVPFSTRNQRSSNASLLTFTNGPWHLMFNIALMAFECISGQCPAHTSVTCASVKTVSARARLRSADQTVGTWSTRALELCALAAEPPCVSTNYMERATAPPQGHGQQPWYSLKPVWKPGFLNAPSYLQRTFV